MRLFYLILALNGPIYALDLLLPTGNEALLKGDGAGYFQFVDRNFEGQQTTPWEGGQFGFWRDPRRVGSGIAYARFHEGMDVKPLQRDAKGNPLDEVKAILAGEVVYVTPSGKSNYGSYLVIKHDWGEGPFYSLYAHLKEALVTAGTKVTLGQVVARMGYTGSGIDQRRAHLHVELNVMLNPDFELWHNAGFSTPNHHGIYNGMNLLGLDLQGLYLAQAKDPALTLRSWWRSQEVEFEIAVPGSARIEVVKTHPWLREGTAPTAPSWHIRCTRWGLPVSIKAGTEAVSAPALTWIKGSNVPHYYATRGLISNSSKIAVEGMRFINLMAGQ